MPSNLKKLLKMLRKIIKNLSCIMEKVKNLNKEHENARSNGWPGTEPGI